MFMRLTSRNEQGVAYSTDGIAAIVERLAAYEETGLTPEVCANYRQFEDEAIKNGVTFNRIVELMEADADGRIKIYDKVDKCCGKCINFEPEEVGKRSGHCKTRKVSRGYYMGLPVICSYSKRACTSFTPKG